MRVQRQVPIEERYRGTSLGLAFRADLIVDGTYLLELKSIDNWAPVHEAQVVTYLKLTRLPVGYLLSFNHLKMTDGIRRILLPRSPQ